MGYLSSIALPPYPWFLQHVILHHSRTNDWDYDNDINIPFNTYPKIVLNLILVHVSYFFTAPIFFSYGFTERKEKYGIKYTQHGDLIPWIVMQMLEMYVIGFLNYIIVKIMYATVFLFFARLSHNQPDLEAVSSSVSYINYHDPHFLDTWCRNQLLTTINYGTQSRIIWWLSFALSHQIEHHLFPYVSHYHYPNLQPHIKKVLAKHNVKYIDKSFYDAVIDCCRSMKPKIY
jgi:linoleoyl-CoA desaturase